MNKIVALIWVITIAATVAPAAADTFTLRQAPYLPSMYVSDGLQESLDLSDATGDAGKSANKAFLYSLLLPGLGHQYVGNKSTATAFYIVEGAIWVSFATFLIQEDKREEGYQDYASSFAGVSSGHSVDYYEIIGEYSTFADYENEIKAVGRLVLFPDIDNQSLDDYFVENRVADFEPWVWASEDDRFLYRNKRFSSKRAGRRATWALWTAAANRVVSAVFAVKAARDFNERLGGQAYHIEFGPPRYHPEDEFQTGVSLVGQF